MRLLGGPCPGPTQRIGVLRPRSARHPGRRRMPTRLAIEKGALEGRFDTSLGLDEVRFELLESS